MITFKHKIIFKNLFSLKLYLALKLKFNYSTTYYYLLGKREKYIFLNLSSLTNTLLKLQIFLKSAVKSGNSFCFVSFNPIYFNLTKQLALLSNQNYITGLWINSFFSRLLPFSLYKKIKSKNDLKLSYSRNKSPIFILITSENAENFLSEVSYLHLPIVGIVNPSIDISFFSYAVVCETSSIETIFLYAKLLNFFLLHDKS